MKADIEVGCTILQNNIVLPEIAVNENKSRATTIEVERLLDAISDAQKRDDARTLCAMMRRLSGEEPRVWGAKMVGFGSYHYCYESGRQGEWFITGFSARSSALTLYVMAGFSRYQNLMDRLGKYKTGKSCLYIKRLSDVDVSVLEELVSRSIADMRETHETAAAENP